MISDKRSRGIALPRALFFLIFAISGFSGLIYESIWSHYLKLFLGHAAYAQSLVLMIFMGGLAIGSGLMARYSSRLSKPILFYALVEVIVGVVALFFHELFTGLIELFFSDVLSSVESIGVANALKWTAAGLLILPQSILLGMTFPLMSAGIIRRYPADSGGTLAMLYFSNSIGAAIGVLVSGFWLISLVGLPGTIRIAGLLNIGLAIVVVALLWIDPRRAVAAPAVSAPFGREQVVGRAFLLAAFVTGLASFVYEIAWLRMLSLVLGATTHSFELMLSAFIAGLAFGGLWIRGRIDRISDPVAFSGLVQIIMGVLALLTLPIFMQSFGWMSHLVGALAKNGDGFTLFTLARSAISFAVMLPATFMAGMTLPLFTYVMLRQSSGEGAIGRIYAANTLGAIVGVLFAVHIGLPVLGLKSLIGVGAALDIVLGLGLLYLAGSAVRPVYIAVALGTVMIGVASNLFTKLEPGILASGVYRHGSLATAQNSDVLYYQDGKTASIALTGWADGTRIISSNGKPEAALKEFPGAVPSDDAVTMVMAGSLALAYQSQTRIAANIGLGSGLTTHTLLADPNIERVDTIEIERAVVTAAEGFGFRVHRAFQDPRSQIHIEDAKTYFSLHKTRYDIIVAEPSNPWVSGVASLFTGEFYRTVGKYLGDEGLFVQWLQLYEFNDGLFSSVLRSLDESFADFIIYHADNGNLLIVAKPVGELPPPDFTGLFEGAMKKELTQVGINGPDDFLVRQIADKQMISNVLTQFTEPANSDYYPYVDLNAGRARFVGEVSTLLPGLSVSQLPITELLGRDSPTLAAVTTSATFSRAANVAQASDIYNAVSGEGASGPIPFETSRDIAAVRLGAENCLSNMPAELWLATVHSLAAPILSNLDREVAVRFVSGLIDENCLQQQSDSFKKIFAVYGAIAARDTTAMTTTALAVLPGLSDTQDTVRSRYALTSGILGALVNEQPELARQLWLDYSGVVLSGSAEIPVDLLILTSFANIK